LQQGWQAALWDGAEVQGGHGGHEVSNKWVTLHRVQAWV
jgi:hypothetical protein